MLEREDYRKVLALTRYSIHNAWVLMQLVTCFSRSLLLWLWSPWGWEEALPSLSVLTQPPTISSLPGVCSNRKLLLSALTELRGRCNLHISAPRGCNPWGQKPAPVLWSVCRIQVLRRERDLLRRCCRLEVSSPTPPTLGIPPMRSEESRIC